jgi:hypothetical protein
MQWITTAPSVFGERLVRAWLATGASVLVVLFARFAGDLCFLQFHVRALSCFVVWLS